MLTDADRRTLCGELERTRDLALVVIDGLTEAQWNFRPAPAAWSIAEIAEHIFVSEANIFERVNTMILATPEPERAAEVAGRDRIVRQRVPVRGRQTPAPEPMRPTGRYINAAQMAEAIGEARARTLRFAATTAADLRAFFEPHPAVKLLDAYQWLLFVAAHTERHVRQTEEWKQSPEYPHA